MASFQTCAGNPVASPNGRRLLRWITVFAFGSWPLFGQVLLDPGSPTTWKEGALYTLEVGRKSVTRQMPPNTTEKIPLPETTLRCSGFFHGRAAGFFRDPEKPGVSLRTTEDFRTWQTVGQVAWASPGCGVVPLKNGDFLVFGFIPMVHRGKASLFAIAKVDSQGKVRLDRLVDPGYGLPLCKQAKGGGPWITEEKLHSITQMTVEPDNPLPLGDHIAFVSGFTGHVLVFDGRTGEPLKRFSIYPSIKEEHLALKSLDADHMVLRAYPKPDGDILLIARTEDAFQEISQVIQRQKVSDLGFDPHQTTDYGARRQKLAKANEKANERLQTLYPRLDYLELHGQLFTATPIPTPRGLPDRVSNLSALKAFKPRLNVKGDLVLDGAVQ